MTEGLSDSTNNIPGFVGSHVDRIYRDFTNHNDFLALPELPQKTIRKEQQNLLREYRKLFDCNPDHGDPRDVNHCFFDFYDDAVEMCSGK